MKLKQQKCFFCMAVRAERNMTRQIRENGEIAYFCKQCTGQSKQRSDKGKPRIVTRLNNSIDRHHRGIDQ